MDWLKAKAEEALKMKVQKEARNEKVDIDEIGPQCPNCQSSLLKAVGEEEQKAMTQVMNIVGLMTNSNVSVEDSIEDGPGRASIVDPESINVNIGL